MKGGDENQAVLVVEIAVIEILGGGPDDRFLIRIQEKNCAMSLLYG
jgi:hypothetical protein